MKFKQLFSIDTNAKTVKGQQYGFMTGILYLAPYKLSGYQVCSMADMAQCHEPCLNMAGRGAFSSVQKARIAKTKRFFEDRDAFMFDTFESVRALVRKAARENLTPLVRLNGTSDIRWEDILFQGKTLFDWFPDVQFYDYTKIPNRKNIPANYDLTFSYSGIASFQSTVRKAIDSNQRMAVVFRHKSKVQSMLANGDAFLGLMVVDGDDTDIRHLDPQSSVVALYAKGKAKTDQSGFVVN